MKKSLKKTTSSTQSGKPTEFDDYVIHGLKVGYSNKQIKHFALVIMYLLFVTKQDSVTFSLMSTRDIAIRTKKRNFKTRLERFFVGVGVFIHGIKNKFK